MTGREDAALYGLGSALSLDSNIPQAPYLLASCLERVGRLDDQRYFYNFGTRSFTANLEFAAGALLLQHRKASAARAHLSRALQLDPNNAETYFDLAVALQVEGDVAGAIAQYDGGLRRSSNNAAALNNLAWILSVNGSDALRDGPRAEKLARRACELTDFKQAISIVTLSAAQAEAGHFDEAIQTSQKACDLAAASGQTNVLIGSTRLLKSFQQHVPWREQAVARKSPD
jgi:Flp pilus assembly protein TadD